MRIKYKGYEGFTLLELSISLIVIGLVVGGVFVGTSLVRTAELQRVIAEVDNYTKALQLFKEQYHALPGDMPDAESFWGTDDAGCPGSYTATAHSKTCNGNGDGFIGGADGASDYFEWYRAWQQLANAGMVDGSFNGISGGGSSHDARIGINVPASKFNNAGYTLGYLPPSNGTGSLWAGAYGHRFMFGSKVTNGDTSGAVLKPQDAFYIDDKIDDGKPAFGNVLTAPSAVYNGCTTSDTATSSEYVLTETRVKCGLIFVTGF